jgi:hypothetical protein
MTDKPIEFNSKKIINLQETRTKITELYKEQKKRHPLLQDEDIRLYFLIQITSLIFDIELMFTVGEELHYDEWWMYRFEKKMSEQEKTSRISSFEKAIQINLIHLPFSLIEDAFRRILRAIDPVACLNSTAEFTSIRECLLNTKLKLVPNNQVLELYSLVRNCIHNNGVHYHRKMDRSAVVFYGNTMYKFPHGKKVIYQDGLPILTMITDVVKLFLQMCESPIMSAIPLIPHINS